MLINVVPSKRLELLHYKVKASKAFMSTISSRGYLVSILKLTYFEEYNPIGTKSYLQFFLNILPSQCSHHN